MSLPVITHPDTLTPTNKLNDIIYGHEHTITGKWPYSEISDTPTIPDLSSLIGKTIQFPVLIESKTISAGTDTITFSNLDGDTDISYILDLDLFMPSVSGDHYIYIRPNNDTGSNYYRNFFGLQGGTVTNGYANDGVILYQVSGNNTRGFANYLIRAVSGYYRVISGDYSIQYSTAYRRNVNTVWWKNTTSNITSLVLTMTSGGSFEGTIKLYKLVDITL